MPTHPNCKGFTKPQFVARRKKAPLRYGGFDYVPREGRGKGLYGEPMLLTYWAKEPILIEKREHR